MKTLKLLLPALLALALSGRGFAAEENLTYRGACNAEDRWELPTSFPENLRALAQVSDAEKSTAFWAAIQGRLRGKNPAEKQFSTYLTWRVLYDLGAIHSAHRGFVQFLNSRDVAPALRQAAFECLGNIHRNFKSTHFLVGEKDALLQENGNGPTLTELRFRLFVQLIGDPKTDRSLIHSIVAKIKSSPPHAVVADAMLAIQSGDQPLAIRKLGETLTLTLPPDLEKFSSYAHLTLARYASAEGRVKDAAEHYAAVPANSEWYTQALTELGWTQLRAKDYRGALGVAYNGWLPGFNDLFLPDPTIIGAISFLETCHTPEARKSLRLFSQRFFSTFTWLKNWNTQVPRTSPEKIYGQAIAFARGEGKVPAQVGSEWLRLPAFLSSQSEINALADEKLVLEKLAAAPTPVLSPKLRGKFIFDLKKNVLTRETYLVSRIGYFISAANYRMLQKMYDLIENSRFVEIEVISGAGEEKLISKKSKDRNADPAAVSAESNLLNWGRRPAFSAGKDEVWADEVGFFRADVESLCAKN